MATINLSRYAVAENPAWLVDSVRYQFAAADAVPEPATMLMVGLGIAGIARHVRRRRARA